MRYDPKMSGNTTFRQVRTRAFRDGYNRRKYNTKGLEGNTYLLGVYQDNYNFGKRTAAKHNRELVVYTEESVSLSREERTPVKLQATAKRVVRYEAYTSSNSEG